MVEFIIAKCKTKAAFSANVRHPIKLNLAKIKQKFEVVLDTPIVIVVKVQGIDVIVHNYGELLFKQEAEVAVLEKIAESIYRVGLDKS